MRGTIRILHVDDDPGFLRLTAKLLAEENEQFEIVSKSRIAEAAAYLDEDPNVDCIVCDYALSTANGIEFLETVRSEYPHLPFILFTGRGSESVASEALTHGATDYLQKQSGPEQYELLANRIENAVEQYRNRLEHEISERSRQELYRITTDPSLSTSEKTQQLLELGCERLGVENGHVVEIDPEAGRHAVRNAAGSGFVEADTVTELDETYCRETISSENILTVYNAVEEGWGEDPAYQRWDIGCYIGGKIEIGGELYGTVCFVDSTPRNRPFTEAERTFVDLVTRWLSQLFEREAYERELEEYETLIDSLPIGYARLSAEGELLAANPAFVAMVGGESEQDVLGHSVDELYADSAGGERFTEQLREAGQILGLETELTTLAGETLPVSLTGQLVEHGRTQYFDTLVEARE